MKSGAQIQVDFRARQRERGLVLVSEWVPTADVASIRAMALRMRSLHKMDQLAAEIEAAEAKETK